MQQRVVETLFLLSYTVPFAIRKQISSLFCAYTAAWLCNLWDSSSKSKLQMHTLTGVLIGLSCLVVVCLTCPYCTLYPWVALIKQQAQGKGCSFVILASRLEQPSPNCQDKKNQFEKRQFFFIYGLSLWLMWVSAFPKHTFFFLRWSVFQSVRFHHGHVNVIFPDHVAIQGSLIPFFAFFLWLLYVLNLI